MKKNHNSSRLIGRRMMAPGVGDIWWEYFTKSILYYNFHFKNNHILSIAEGIKGGLNER